MAVRNAKKCGVTSQMSVNLSHFVVVTMYDRNHGRSCVFYYHVMSSKKLLEE